MKNKAASRKFVIKPPRAAARSQKKPPRTAARSQKKPPRTAVLWTGPVRIRRPSVFTHGLGTTPDKWAANLRGPGRPSVTNTSTSPKKLRVTILNNEVPMLTFYAQGTVAIRIEEEPAPVFATVNHSIIK